ncbi:WD40-repeat-containing domain protein [Cantharellus anzutake]|uniref:WD40-repeat-containing domain protein n=1 Tax=Cantharellus anzutake TaxID=1750568 RepID=UPI0019089673|nr:WD40-repeat-containing domain protein [Cantharellus anzutake]KAF8342234.1 WD40-repeat-containing domain protein [Cantharellus anzutake]
MPLPRVEESNDALLSGGAKGVFSQEGFQETEDDHPEDFFETEPGLNALNAIEPLEDDEGAGLITGVQPPPVTQTFTTFSNSSTISNFSTFSGASTLSIRSSGKTFSLKDLCENVIGQHLWLQTARIVSTSCYSQYRNFILHRFLILQLWRPGKKDIWLRIDRRAGLSLLQLARKLGKTGANDTVQLSASEEALTGEARRENIQIFKRPPFLGDFGVYLRVISEELLEYKIWPENCWTFCSLLQEHLGISGDGDYTFGILVARNIAPLVRQRISERVMADVTPRMKIMTALQSSARWQFLNLAKPRGWLGRSVWVFFTRTANLVQDSDTHYRPQDILKWITDFSLSERLEKADLHSRVALHCIDILGRLPKENPFQLPNPLILNSDIPDLALKIQSKISSDVEYAALYGLLHVAAIGNPSTELLNKLETFFVESMMRWLEVLSLLGATKNALVELDKVFAWYQGWSRNLQDRSLGKSLLRSLLRCRRFVYQYYGVISVSAGHIGHSAMSHSSDSDWQMQYPKSFDKYLPTAEGLGSGWDGCLNIIRGHPNAVISVSFSSDGSRIASASSDARVGIWDVVTGEELCILRGHASWVFSVSFSSDGSRAASASMDGTVRIWDTAVGEELKVLRGHASWVLSVSFSSNGSRVASASLDGTVRIWDAVAGDELKVLRGHHGSVQSVSFSSDGSRVASASSDMTIRIWNAVTWGQLKVLRGHTDWVTSVSLSSDGSRVASASSDSTVRIWDAATGKGLKTLQGHAGLIQSVSLSSDGSRVASASDYRTIRIWDAVTGEELKVLLGHTDWVTSVSFSSDGSKVASASSDRTVRIWDAVIGEAISVGNKSFHSDLHKNPFSDPVAIPYDCSFAEVKHDKPNRLHLFLGRCGTPHFIAPSYISDVISNWEISQDGQAITVRTDGHGLFTIRAPKKHRCAHT